MGFGVRFTTFGQVGTCTLVTRFTHYETSEIKKKVKFSSKLVQIVPKSYLFIHVFIYFWLYILLKTSCRVAAEIW